MKSIGNQGSCSDCYPYLPTCLPTYPTTSSPPYLFLPTNSCAHCCVCHLLNYGQPSPIDIKWHGCILYLPTYHISTCIIPTTRMHRCCFCTSALVSFSRCDQNESTGQFQGEAEKPPIDRTESVPGCHASAGRCQKPRAKRDSQYYCVHFKSQSSILLLSTTTTHGNLYVVHVHRFRSNSILASERPDWLCLPAI